MWSVSSMQLGEFSRCFKGSAPSTLILFLLIDYPVEILSFTKVGTSFKATNRVEEPEFPMLTETNDSYLRQIFGKIAVNLMTPSSPNGLLSSTILEMEEMQIKSLMNFMYDASNS
jgi:hypothetical protein